MPLPTDDEWRALVPQIARIAEFVGHRSNASPTVRDELEASAVTYVYERIAQFDRNVSAFSTWCRTVLKNRCVSLIRSEAVRRKRVQGHADAVSQEHEQRLDDDPPPTPLEIAEDDAAKAHRPRLDVVDVLERHLVQPIDRILIVVYAELCEACGDKTLTRWCDEAGGVDAAALRSIESLQQRSRKRALATLLGEKVDWVRQRIFRAGRLLKQSGVGGSEA